MARQSSNETILIECDHFIYTSEKTVEKIGYQIIAKSDGINNEITSEISGYLYPIGINPESFVESKSLLLLSKNKIAYSVVKNVGIGHDLRKGTLYNHTFVLDKKDFSKLQNDSKVLDGHFIHDSSLRGILNKINIDYKPSKIDFESLSKLGDTTLSEILYSIMTRKKLAIVGTFSSNFIPNLLLLVPPSLRLVSFASTVFEPSRQSEYEIIQIPKERVDQIESKYQLVDISEKFRLMDIKPQKHHDEVKYLLYLIKNRKSDKIDEFHSQFEHLQRLSSADKFRLLNYQFLVDFTDDDKKKAEYLIECAKITRKIDAELTEAFMHRAEKFGEKVSDNKLLSEIRLGRLLQNIENSSLSLSTLQQILENVSELDNESKKLILNRIILSKKDDVSRSYFLKDLLKSVSNDKILILQVILENNTLRKIIVDHIIHGAYDENTKLQMIYEMILISKDNYDVLKTILECLEPILDSENGIADAKIFNEIYSNHKFRDNVNPNLLLSYNNKIFFKIQKIIKTNTTKLKSKKITWTSRYDFHPMRHSIFDLLQNLLGCLNYIKDYRRRDITKEQDRKIISQIVMVNKLLDKLQHIKYDKKEEEKKPVAVFNPMRMFFWWLPQNYDEG